jgi:integrase
MQRLTKCRASTLALMDGTMFEDAMKLDLPHVTREKLPSGKYRYRFRINRSAKKITIQGEPGSPEFVAEYHRILHNENADAPAVRGSVSWLVGLYLIEMLRLVKHDEIKPLTERQRRSFLTRLANEHGHRDVLRMDDRAIKALMNKYTPATGNNFLKSVKAMFRWAVEERLVPTNPAADVKKRRSNSEGFRAWTVEELSQFLSYHGKDSQAYLACMLFAFTAVRRGDAVRLGRFGLGNKGGVQTLSWTQEKSGFAPRSRVTIPVMPPLLAAINGPAAGEDTFLITSFGKPYSKYGFGSKFSGWRKEAGLPDGLAAHGIRKAAGTIMAEFGCTDKEIAAVLGHADTATAHIYTAQADSWKLASNAFEKLKSFSL